MNIFVGNLSFEARDTDLGELFGAYGEVDRATVLLDRDTGKSRGFGFVEMPNADDANAAISDCNGVLFFGRKLNVNEARPREGKPQGQPSRAHDDRRHRSDGGRERARW